jgi:RNA polymerase sigma factor (sigma-70 family)
VLPMTTGELGDPVACFVQVVAGDATEHVVVGWYPGASRFEVQASRLDLRDDELLSLASGASGAAEARRAQAVFYERHVRYLYGVLKRREGVLRRIAGLSVEDLVQDTFQRAFQYGGSYAAEPGLPVERERRRTRAWLGRVAQNLIVNALAEPAEIAASPMLERLGTDDVDEPAPPSSPEVRALRRALEDLTEREQDVLRVTALYQKAGEEHQRLPNEVSAELAARWGTNSQNIRAIRSRAMKKLQTHVEAELAQTEENVP